MVVLTINDMQNTEFVVIYYSWTALGLFSAANLSQQQSLSANQEQIRNANGIIPFKAEIMFFHKKPKIPQLDGTGPKGKHEYMNT